MGFRGFGVSGFRDDLDNFLEVVFRMEISDTMKAFEDIFRERLREEGSLVTAIAVAGRDAPGSSLNGSVKCEIISKEGISGKPVDIGYNDVCLFRSAPCLGQVKYMAFREGHFMRYDFGLKFDRGDRNKR